MEKITLVIIPKENEEGLLSIEEGRSKSLIPILGDAKILDYYLYPVRDNNNFKILINIKTSSTEVKDYINYHYRDYHVKQIVGDNIIENLLRIIKREKSPTLIMHANGFVYSSWNLLLKELATFKGRNLIITNEKGIDSLTALYIRERESFYDLIKNIAESKDSNNQDYDYVWEKLISLSEKNYSRVKIKSIEDYRKLSTVKEYYDFHIGLLNNMEECFRYTSLFQNKTTKEEDNVTVASGGIVKNSYISASSYIEGVVENSFIFSNVKVSKGAYIYESIIMNNNHIAENARIERIVLCDGGELLQTVLPRIGEDAVLGGRFKHGSNKEFPDFIYDGISLIGSNVDIPRAFVMSGNCYIPSNTGKLILKEKRKLSNGESLLN